MRPHEGAARVGRRAVAEPAQQRAHRLAHRLALQVPARNVDGGQRQRVDAAGPGMAGGAPALGRDQLGLGGVLPDGEPRERVHRGLERRRERAAEEREPEPGQALVGAELDGDELARVGGGGQPHHQRVARRGAQHMGLDVSDLHGQSPLAAMAVYTTAMRTPVTERLEAWLREEGARYRLLEHAPAFTSAEAARVRGTPPESGAKGLVLLAADKPVQVVLPGSRRVDNARVRALLGTRTLRFATPEELLALTGCVPGAVPPFGNLFGLPVLVDEALAAREEIAFNAGSNDVSIVMATADFLRLSGARVERLASD